jgi:zinc D-Ala-D-Ala carboxypeptidase
MATRATIRRAQTQLNANGFPCGAVEGKRGPKTRAAIRRFKQAWAGGRYGGKPLPINAKLGKAARRALDGLPWLSPHFQAGEFACRHCGQAYVQRGLVVALEIYRSRFGPTRIVSGYRCPVHNANVGGATTSQHMFGTGADIPPSRTTQQVRALGVFSGIGHDGSTGNVRHVDVRHLGPANVTRGTVNAPTQWRY